MYHGFVWVDHSLKLTDEQSESELNYKSVWISFREKKTMFDICLIFVTELKWSITKSFRSSTRLQYYCEYTMSFISK